MVQSFFEQANELANYFFEEEEKVNTRPSMSGKADALVPFYATALGHGEDKISRDLESGLGSVLYAEANSKLNEVNSAVSTNAITAGIAGQNLTMEQIQQASEGLMFRDFVAPDIGILLAESPEYTAQEKRALDRAIAAERMVAERIPEDGGLWAGLGRFGDAAISQGVHNLIGYLPFVDNMAEGEASQLVPLAQEAANLLTMDLPKAEFEEKFGAILDRVNDSGFFTEENPFLLMHFIDLVKEGGVGFESGISLPMQMLDIVTAGTTTMAVRGVMGGASAVPRLLTRTAGSEAATKTVVDSVRNGVDNPTTVLGLESGLTRANGEMFSHPSMSILHEMEAENEFLRLVKQGYWGTRIDPAIMAEKHADFLNTTQLLNSSRKANAIDYSVRVGDTGNVYGVAVMGKTNKGGAVPYTTQEGAQRLAEAVSGEVREVTEGGTTKFVVVKEYDLATQGLAEATDLNEVASGLLSGIMSTTARTTRRLDSLIKQGEQQSARVLREIGRRYGATRRAISRQEGNNIDAIFAELQSDEVYSQRVEPYTNAEFRQRYEEKFGEAASDAVVNHYRAIQDLNDVDYYLNADIVLKEAIDNDETMVELGGTFYRGKRNVSPEADDLVLDVDTGAFVRYSDLNDRAKSKVYEIMDAYQASENQFARYVVGNKVNTRRLYHTDVMPYNAGGHRRYTDVLNIYIKQETPDLQLVGGKAMASRPRTFMAVRTEAEANEVVGAWNNIVEGLKNNPNQINNIIRANNRWNPDIEDIADLQEFARIHNLDLETPIRWAPDGEPLIGDAKLAVAQRFAGENTTGQFFRNRLAVSRKRGAQPLAGYGGENLSILDPTKAIERGFASTVVKRGDMNYLYNSINGWLKAAEKADAITNAAEVAGLPPKQAMLKATLRKTEAGKKLIEERATIQRRMSGLTPQTIAERNFMRGLANWAYGKDKKSLAKLADKASLTDPVGFMRALAFHTKLGMFAIDQFMVQASQLVNVVGITSATIGTKDAIRGALGAFPLRLALVDFAPPGAVERIAKIQAPFTGISPDEFITLRDWIQATGRNVVDKTIVEENNVAAFAYGKTVLDYGQTFFNEGELIARLTAATTNFLERKVRYGVEDIFNNETTRQMIHRQDVLTASMTSASAAPWQRSILAIPLQFTTYQVRMVEQLFTKEILTPKERQRLALAHLLMYGSAAVPGAGFVQDRLGYTGTVDPNSELYSVVRYGAMDAILSEMLGTDTALSSRLAVGEGLADFYEALGDKGFLELAVGPSGVIAWDSLTALKSMVNNIFSGNFEHTKYDWNRLARNSTAYNRAYNTWTAVMYGEYYSRKSEQGLASGLKTPEAFAMALGIPLEQQEALWSTVANTMLDDKFLDAKTREIKRLEAIAIRLVNEGKYEEADKFFQDIGAELSILPLASNEKVRQRLNQSLTIQDVLTRSLINRGRSEWATHLQGLTNE